jgi:lipid A 4'-phosphatase
VKSAAIYVALLALALALFLAAPGIDLATSRLFFVAGSGFPYGRWPPFLLLHHAVPWITAAILAVLAFAAGWLFFAGRPLWRFDRKALLFLLLATAIGPGLLANTLFKDHWGRARPVQVSEFGGTRQFTPAAVPSNQCPRNCSFVSGDAALGFSLIAFAFLLEPGRKRRRGIAAALAFGALIGLARVAEGAHFLSDVVFAGFVVWGSSALLFWWVVERDGLAAPAMVALYRRVGRSAAAAVAEPRARFALSGAAVAVAVILAMADIDRPLARYFHARGPGLHAFFEGITRLGLADGYLTVFALTFAALHWGGRLPRLKPIAARLRALSAVPAFLFAAVAAAGLAVDLIKVVAGRARPKLLFADHFYGFTGLAFHADHWSFPSGHTATIVALMAALWWLWPRHLLFYIAVAAIVAGSRVVVGAHYLSDVIAGAFVAVVMTRLVAQSFARGGIDLAAACRGAAAEAGAPLWPCRRVARRAAEIEVREGREGQ